MASKYQQLKEAGQIGRGRNKKKMTKEQMRDNLERAKLANRQRQEARRRALIILQKNYKDEFDDLYQSELQEIKTVSNQN